MSNPSPVSIALVELRAGRPIVVVDDHDRENEGDLILSAETITRDTLIFAMNNAGGLMCLPCRGSVLDRLGVPQMTSNGNDPLGTPFSVSIDHTDCTTGMSVDDRLKTISLLTNDSSKSNQVRMPGHLFPLRAKEKLLLERRGHTEASIELMRMAGLKEVAIIIEIMNKNGLMTKGQDLIDFAHLHGLSLISVQEIYDTSYHSE